VTRRKRLTKKVSNWCLSNEVIYISLLWEFNQNQDSEQ